MNIYLVERTDNVGWDEFNAGVIVAEDENAALNIAHSELSGRFINSSNVWDTAVVTKVGLSDNDEARIILTDFKAG